MNIINCILKKNFKELKDKLEKNDEDINALSSSGNTYLILAITESFEKGAILLIEKGINVSILNKNHDSSLSVAAEYNAYDVAKLIIEKDRSLINTPDSYGNIPLWTAITYACKKVDIDYRMIDLLIENGADIYLPNKNNQTCLYLIERRERFEIIEHIKNKFPHLNIS